MIADGDEGDANATYQFGALGAVGDAILVGGEGLDNLRDLGVYLGALELPAHAAGEDVSD